MRISSISKLKGQRQGKVVPEDQPPTTPIKTTTSIKAAPSSADGADDDDAQEVEDGGDGDAAGVGVGKEAS